MKNKQLTPDKPSCWVGKGPGKPAVDAGILRVGCKARIWEDSGDPRTPMTVKHRNQEAPQSLPWPPETARLFLMAPDNNNYSRSLFSWLRLLYSTTTPYENHTTAPAKSANTR